MRSAIHALCLLSVACATHRQEPPVTLDSMLPTATMPDHRVDIVIENDSVGIGDTTDKGYTNGVRLEWTLPTAWTPDFASDVAAWLPLAPAETRGPALGFVFGQEMFTPEDITLRNPPPSDRPYAGWLYGGVVVRNLNLGSDNRRDRLDTWELDLGVVGPSSRADVTQIEWHELIDARRPNGWDNQLHDEFGVVLAYDRRLRAVYEPRWLGPIDADVLAHVGGKLGNVHTRATVGGALRLGVNLPRDFGTGLASTRTAGRRGESHVFLVAGVDGHFVLRNIFLDGNTFRDSPSVDRTPFVADFHLGLEAALTQRIRLSYVHVFRTPEFDSPTASARPQDFASIRLTFLF